MVQLFKKTKELEAEFEEYLDLIVQGGLLFRQGIRFYLNDEPSDFEDRLISLDQCESQADNLRRELESKLYLQTLIPDARGDVLGILESVDHVLNMASDILLGFSVERPSIPDKLSPTFLELTEASISAMEAMVTSIRAYFTDLTAVRDHISKTRFYEHESDKIAEKIKRTIFENNTKLGQKLHLRQFVRDIEQIADAAEDVCDRLSIATIKRHI